MVKTGRSSQQRARLAAEIDILSRLRHPNVVQFLGACTRAEPVTIVSEILEGGSLEDALQLQPHPPLRRALEITLDCARGLNYLHRSRPDVIVHRDIKPANILLAKAYQTAQVCSVCCVLCAL